MSDLKWQPDFCRFLNAKTRPRNSPASLKASRVTRWLNESRLLGNRSMDEIFGLREGLSARVLCPAVLLSAPQIAPERS